MSQWSDDLVCEWVSWEVAESTPNTLVLRMADGHCCDMGGAIRIGKALMPDVRRIVTISGAKPDTVYVCGNGGWEAQRSF